MLIIMKAVPLNPLDPIEGYFETNQGNHVHHEGVESDGQRMKGKKENRLSADDDEDCLSSGRVSNLTSSTFFEDHPFLELI